MTRKKSRWTQADIDGLGRNEVKVSLPISDANSLKKSILKVLNLCGYKAWRQNNGAVYDAKKKVFRRNSSFAGVPDVIGFCKRTGVFIAVEIKAGKDRLSDAQEDFLNEASASGCLTFIISSSSDIERMQKELLKK